MSYIESIILGVSFAAIPGPIFFEVLRRTLTKGFWSGALLSVGEFLANFTILMLTFFGISNFLLYNSVKLGLFLVGGAILIWIGTIALKINEKDIEKSSKKSISKSNSIIVGFALAISSPLAIAVWISIGGAYLVQYSSKLVSFINILLLALGVMIFFFVLVSIIHFSRHKISNNIIVWFSRIFGIVLIGYGSYFLYQFIKII
jgi:threonine/homoserine/homoserine lactone efflux protein